MATRPSGRRQAAHRGVKAEGGWAAVCTEYAPISPDSDEAPLIAARFWDQDDMRALRLMTDTAHEHGALAGVELHHSGAHAPNRQTRWPSIAPSQLASDLEPDIVPKAMELSDIRRVQDDWAAAAIRARDCGADLNGKPAPVTQRSTAEVYFVKRNDTWKVALFQQRDFSFAGRSVICSPEQLTRVRRLRRAARCWPITPSCTATRGSATTSFFMSIFTATPAAASGLPTRPAGPAWSPN